MFGQGSPAGALRRRIRAVLSVFALISLVLGGNLCAQAPPSTVPIRLNLSWTTESPRLWEGEIGLENGFFWNSVPLGSDLNASVTFARAEENSGVIRFRTPAAVPFCGIQTTAVADENASIRLSMRTKTGERLERSFKLADLAYVPAQIPFDAAGNGLTVERAPGDILPLSVSRVGGERFEKPAEMTPSMVFDRGETLIVGLFTKYLPTSDQPRRLELTLVPTDLGEKLWSTAIELTDAVVAEHPRLDIEVPLDDLDGPFDLRIELTCASEEKGRFLLFPQKEGKAVLASRVIQGVVVAPMPDSAVSNDKRGKNDESDLRAGLIETVDPTNPAWWKIFSRAPLFSDWGAAGKPAENGPDAVQVPGLPGESVSGVQSVSARTTEFLNKWRLSELRTRVQPLTLGSVWGQWDGFWQRPLGSGHLTPFENGSFVRLGPTGDRSIDAWEAYTIPIKEPGKPHLLEVDYPADVEQVLGVSVLEPSVTGGLFPRSLDGGVVVRRQPFDDRVAGRVLRCQILFWPKTKTPTILMTAPDPEQSAIYGRMRVYRVKDGFADEPLAQYSGRSFAAVMARPFLCDEFLAPRRISPIGVLGAEDWKTFDSAARRLTESLTFAGCDTLLMSVAADSSALYPSNVLKPNPKYDSGVFLPNGDDPVRKDVPELIYRLFDKRGMTFLPMITFNAPLAPLEEGDAASADGLHWIGPDGKALVLPGENGSAGFAPYNLLNGAVQGAILQTLDELAARYAHHPSFAGVGIELSPQTFAVLPDDLRFGLDDTTFRRFLADINAQNRYAQDYAALVHLADAADADRFRRRALLIDERLRDDWILWRAESVRRFWQKAAVLLTARQPNARLHLVWTGTGPDRTSDAIFAPANQRAFVRCDCLTRAGYRPELFASDGNIVFYRPGRISGRDDFLDRLCALDAESPESIASFEFNGQTRGAFFYHDAVPRNLPTFDAQSLFHPTVTELETRPLPSDDENRRRFAHQLACSETLLLADGGRMIPLSGAESMREWLDVWRRLPAEPFETYVAQTAQNSGDSSASTPSGAPNGSKIEVSADSTTESLQPIVCRTLRTGDAFWAYLVNDAPFHCGVNLSIDFSPDARAEVFVGGRAAVEPDWRSGRFRWNLSLRPYDLVALKITDPNASVVAVKVARPEEICAFAGRLEKELNAAFDRVLIAGAGLPLALANAGFNTPAFVAEPDSVELATPGNTPKNTSESVSKNGEDKAPESKKTRPLLGLDIPKVNLLKNPFGSPNAADLPANTGADSSPDAALLPSEEAIVGWNLLGDDRIRAQIDPVHFREGDASLRLTNSGTVGGIVSSPFAAPISGRLFVSVTFGLPENTPDLPLRVSLFGRCDGVLWQRQLTAGPTVLRRARERVASGEIAPENGILWVRDVLQFDGLPIEGLEDLSIRFDLLDRGVVWLDDLKLYKTAFTRPEREALTDAIRSAAEAYRSGRVCDAMAFLDSPSAAVLAREIPDNSPLWSRCPERPEYARLVRAPEQIAQTPPEPAEPTPAKKKNFFQKIIPW